MGMRLGRQALVREAVVHLRQHCPLEQPLPLPHDPGSFVYLRPHHLRVLVEGALDHLRAKSCVEVLLEPVDIVRRDLPILFLQSQQALLHIVCNRKALCWRSSVCIAEVAPPS